MITHVLPLSMCAYRTCAAAAYVEKTLGFQIRLQFCAIAAHERYAHMDNSSTQNYSRFRIFLQLKMRLHNARSKDQEVGTRQKTGVGVAFFSCYACGRLRYVPQDSPLDPSLLN